MLIGREFLWVDTDHKVSVLWNTFKFDSNLRMCAGRRTNLMC